MQGGSPGGFFGPSTNYSFSSQPKGAHPGTGIRASSRAPAVGPGAGEDSKPPILPANRTNLSGLGEAVSFVHPRETFSQGNGGGGGPVLFDPFGR